MIDLNLDDALAAIWDEWGRRMGFGSCGHYAAMRREDGSDDVAYCWAVPVGALDPATEGFGHYVIVTRNGGIIDLASTPEVEPEYTDVENLAPGKLPELVTPESLARFREAMNRTPGHGGAPHPRREEGSSAPEGEPCPRTGWPSAWRTS